MMVSPDMVSPEVFVEEKEGKSLQELIAVRDELIDFIRDFEKNCIDFEYNEIIGKGDVLYAPSADVQYQMYLEYLSAISLLICEKFNFEFEQDDFDLDDDEEIDAIVEKMIEVLHECEPGTRTTTARLYCKLFENNGDDVPFETMNEIDSRLKMEARDRGLLLDSSDFNNADIGLPFNIRFTVYKQNNANTNLDCLKLITFKIGGFHAANESLFIKIGQEKEAKVDYYKYHFFENKDRTFEISEELLTELSCVIKNVDVCSWSNYYYNSCLDSFEWNMAICDSNYNCILTEGSNGVPKGFDKVFVVLKKIGLDWEETFEPDWIAQGGISDYLRDFF
jgi:hypothetical protein